MNLKELRTEYLKGELDTSNVHLNPFEQFNKWFDEAKKAEITEANAMYLATASVEGKPSIRTVLLKEVIQDTFIFFTNYLSRKGKEIEENPNVSLLFFWKELERQVRIEGKIEKIKTEASNKYFYSRPITSQWGAMASPQSTEIKSREIIENNIQELMEKNLKPTRPEHWGGYAVMPSYFEFWQGRASRLHDRIVYQQENQSWKIIRLAP